MITLRPTVKFELVKFVDFENEQDAIENIIPYSIDKHRECFDTNSIVYLSIYSEENLVGFILLIIEGESVEFRRIVISKIARGIGQQAIHKLHEYCADILGVRRIWLDVFENNKCAMHIYTKLGYEVSGYYDHEKGKLIIMEKNIQPLR